MTEAFYGNLSEAADGTVVDVTVPLQALVSNSQLHVHATSKASILGFFDPCPGEPKQLRIRYVFRKTMHEVTVDDDEAVALPMRCTRAI